MGMLSRMMDLDLYADGKEKIILSNRPSGTYWRLHAGAFTCVHELLYNLISF